MLLFIFSIFLIKVDCEWVEITVSSSKNHKLPTSKEMEKFATSTIASYETVMKTPTYETTTKLNNITIIDLAEAKLANETIKENVNYDNIVPFLNNIQQLLLKNSQKSVKSKMEVLRNLRDNLLFEIEAKMDKLWPFTNRREARESHDEIDFPSNESALMTIGFLTFAVFLIKLVLKLIVALKYKNNQTMMVPATTYYGRKKRHTNSEDMDKILQLIEEYKFK